MDALSLMQKKSNHVSFMTTKDRELFPTMAPDRLGNEMNVLYGAPNRGPGCYDNEEKTNLSYVLDNRPTTHRGYVIGARTCKRFRHKQTSTLTPAPCDHQKHVMRPKTFTPEYEPFNIKCDQYPSRSFEVDNTPGPGTYPHDEILNKHVEWHQAFGGRPINLPKIEVQSTIKKNTKKLYGTNEENVYQRKLAYFKLFF